MTAPRDVRGQRSPLIHGDIESIKRVRVLLTSGWFMVIGFVLRCQEVVS